VGEGNIRYFILNAGTSHCFASYGSALGKYNHDSLEGKFSGSYDVFSLHIWGFKHIKGKRKFFMVKGKAVPLQARRGPEGSRKLRLPDFVTTAQDGGKVVSLMHRPLLPPGNTLFC